MLILEHSEEQQLRIGRRRSTDSPPKCGYGGYDRTTSNPQAGAYIRHDDSHLGSLPAHQQ
jgi:hypothetical protein